MWAQISNKHKANVLYEPPETNFPNSLLFTSFSLIVIDLISLRSMLIVSKIIDQWEKRTSFIRQAIQFVVFVRLLYMKSFNNFLVISFFDAGQLTSLEKFAKKSALLAEGLKLQFCCDFCKSHVHTNKKFQFPNSNIINQQS